MSTTTNSNANQLPQPTPWPGLNRRLIIGGGAPMQPLQRVGAFSEDEFERFVLEWVHGYLNKEYTEIEQRGSAGDKGRDIVAWIDSHTSNHRRWDNYQCKHYKDPLTPSDIWVELGKLCYYTHNSSYTKPEHLFFVTHKGVGNSLADLLKNPVKLRNELIANWDKYCKDKITIKCQIPLEDDFAKYVNSFDFSIVQAIPPMDLIAQHRETPYHALLFGTSLKPRLHLIPPPTEITDKEARYVEQLFEAFSDYTNSTITNFLELTNHTHLKKAFDHARVCFYCTESLKEFARDALPDEMYFSELMDLFEEGIVVTLNSPHQSGYERMNKTLEIAVSLQIGSHALREELRPNDRKGICHHLANDDRIHWVQK